MNHVGLCKCEWLLVSDIASAVGSFAELCCTPRPPCMCRSMPPCMCTFSRDLQPYICSLRVCLQRRRVPQSCWTSSRCCGGLPRRASSCAARCRLSAAAPRRMLQRASAYSRSWPKQSMTSLYHRTSSKSTEQSCSGCRSRCPPVVPHTFSPAVFRVHCLVHCR